MIRPFTCLCLLVAAGSGLYLYSAKHDAQMLDREITRLGRKAQESRGRAALMRAEYDRLGDPDRLRELASQVLALQPTDPVQFASMADLEKRLLAVGATIQVNIGVPAEPPQLVASIPEAVAKPPAAPVLVAAALPIAEHGAPQPAEKWVTERPAPPIQLAAAKPSAALPRPAPVPAPAPVVVQQPAALVPSPSAQAAAQQASYTPPRAPLVRQAAAETRPAPRPASAPVRAVTPDAPAVPSAPVFASALGMARVLAPLPANALTPTSYTPSALGVPMMAPARR